MAKRRFYLWLSTDFLAQGSLTTGEGSTLDYPAARGENRFDWDRATVGVHAAAGADVPAYVWNHVGSAGTPRLEKFFDPALAPNSSTDPLANGQYPSNYAGPELSFLVKAHGDPVPNSPAITGTTPDSMFDPTVTVKVADRFSGLAPRFSFIGRISAIEEGDNDQEVEITLTAGHGRELVGTFTVFIHGIGGTFDPQLTGKHTATSTATNKFKITLPSAWTGQAGILPGGMVHTPEQLIAGITAPGGNIVRLTILPGIALIVDRIVIGGITGTGTQLNGVWRTDKATLVNSNTIDIDVGATPNVAGLSGGYIDTFGSMGGPWTEAYGLLGSPLGRVKALTTLAVASLATQAEWDSGDTVECDGVFLSCGFSETAAGGGTSEWDTAIKQSLAFVVRDWVGEIRRILAAQLTGGQTASEIPVLLCQFSPDLRPNPSNPVNNLSGLGTLETFITRSEIAKAASLLPNCALVETNDLPRNATQRVVAGIERSPDGEIDLGLRLWDAKVALRAGETTSALRGVPVYLYIGQSNAQGTVPFSAALNGDDPDYDGSWYDLGGNVIRERKCFIWNSGTLEFSEYAPQLNAQTLPADVSSRWPSLAVNTTPNVAGPIGPEASLLLQLRKRHSEGVYLWKFAINGAALQELSGLPTFSPTGGDLAQSMLQEWSRIIEWFQSEGLFPDVRGVFFDQGESDAGLNAARDDSAGYEDALREWITWLRDNFQLTTTSRSPLPVVIARVNSHPRWIFNTDGLARVRSAQLNVANTVTNVALADMDGLPIRQDNIHRTFIGTIESGKRMAVALANTTLATDAPEIPGQNVALNPDLALLGASSAESVTLDATAGVTEESAASDGLLLGDTAAGLTYATVEEANLYLARVGTPATWDALDDAEKAASLRYGSWYLDVAYGHRWKGYRSSQEQPLDWPRRGVCDRDGYAYLSTEVPDRVKHAAIEAASRHAQGTDLFPDQSEPGSIKRERVKADVVETETEYVGGRSQMPRFGAIDRLLTGLVRSASSGVVTRDERYDWSHWPW
jgi:hypothetical protein